MTCEHTWIYEGKVGFMLDVFHGDVPEIERTEPPQKRKGKKRASEKISRESNHWSLTTSIRDWQSSLANKDANL